MQTYLWSNLVNIRLSKKKKFLYTCLNIYNVEVIVVKHIFFVNNVDNIVLIYCL